MNTLSSANLYFETKQPGWGQGELERRQRGRRRWQGGASSAVGTPKSAVRQTPPSQLPGWFWNHRENITTGQHAPDP